jgi:hypothetical protein
MLPFGAHALPVPKNWQDFERNAAVLFECLLDDPHTQLNGRHGQRQNGVDFFGRRQSSGQWVGVQCKGRKVGYGQRINEKELRLEAAKAKSFSPVLSEFFLLTTAPQDGRLQEVARSITQQESIAGRNFAVSVWGWEQIELEIARHDRAIQAFHPDALPFSNQIRTTTNRLEQKLDGALRMLETLAKRGQQSNEGEPFDESEITDHLDSAQVPQSMLDGLPDIERQIVSKIRKALRSSFLEGLLEAYRGLEELPRVEGVVYRGYSTLSESSVGQYDPGEIVHWKTFVSATTDPLKAYFGNTLFVIHSKTGRVIGPPDDDEIIFAPRTQFLVHAMERRGEFVVIELEEIE